MNKGKQLEAQIKAIAVIEDEFKALGKCLYACWLDKARNYDFEGIMQNFDGLLKSLVAKKSKLNGGKK